ncbi:MAG: inositol monophosphatase [Chloroflexi bacterium]|nr:inositol monophosphatase [Chloroflexota bacterium]
MTEPPAQAPLPPNSVDITDSELKHVEQSVIRATRAAGELVASRFEGILEISEKGDRPGKDLVTDVDKASQRLIAEIMAESCPSHMLLGEEDPPDEEPVAADWIWVVDPVDGTTNFINSSIVHAVSIAAIYRGVPMAAAMWIPWPNKNGFQLMHARAGNGTRMDGSDERLRVHPASESGAPVAGVLSARPGWFLRMYDVREPLKANLGEKRIGGSSCYEQFMVAKGSMQYSITGRAFTWDFAAGTLLVKEAGGKVLATNSDRNFVEFAGWGQNYANDPATYGRLRKWTGLLLLGAPATVDFIAANLKPRRTGISGLVDRARAALGRLFANPKK